MAFLFVVGVYGLVGLGLLWLIEGLTVKKWQLFAWLPQAGKQVDSEATEQDSELTERERDREPSRIAAREMEWSETPQ